MPQKLLLYATDGAYEPSISLYFLPAVSGIEATATAMADEYIYLICNTVEASRWEWISALGVYVTGGTLGQAGAVNLSRAETSLCSLVRINSTGGIKRNSTKYFHFVPSLNMRADGPDTAWLSSLATFAALHASLGGCDSDGAPVTTYTYRHPSRRTRINKLI